MAVHLLAFILEKLNDGVDDDQEVNVNHSNENPEEREAHESLKKSCERADGCEQQERLGSRNISLEIEKFCNHFRYNWNLRRDTFHIRNLISA